jgi:hypothetical protein
VASVFSAFVHEEDRGIYIAARPGSSKKLLIGIY